MKTHPDIFISRRTRTKVWGKIKDHSFQAYSTGRSWGRNIFLVCHGLNINTERSAIITIDFDRKPKGGDFPVNWVASIAAAAQLEPQI